MKNSQLIWWLGLAGMVGGAAFSLINLLELLHPSMGPRGAILNAPQFRVYMLTLGLVVMPGFFAGQLGYHRLGAGGGGIFSKIILGVAAIGCSIFIAATLYTAATLIDTGAPGIGIMLNMLLAPLLWAVAALRSRKVAMWKRVWPLLMALAPLFLFGVAVPAGLPNFAAPVFVGLFWLVFGFAVLTEVRQPASLDQTA